MAALAANASKTQDNGHSELTASNVNISFCEYEISDLFKTSDQLLVLYFTDIIYKCSLANSMKKDE